MANNSTNTNAYIGSITGDALAQNSAGSVGNSMLNATNQVSKLGSPFYNNNPSPDDTQPALINAANQRDNLFGTQMAFGTHINHPSNPFMNGAAQTNLNNTPGITNPMPEQYNPANQPIKPVQPQTPSKPTQVQPPKIPTNNASNQALMGKVGNMQPSPMSGILSQGINQPKNIAQ